MSAESKEMEKQEEAEVGGAELPVCLTLPAQVNVTVKERGRQRDEDRHLT